MTQRFTSPLHIHAHQAQQTVQYALHSDQLIGMTSTTGGKKKCSSKVHQALAACNTRAERSKKLMGSLGKWRAAIEVFENASTDRE